MKTKKWATLIIIVFSCVLLTLSCTTKSPAVAPTQSIPEPSSPTVTPIQTIESPPSSSIGRIAFELVNENDTTTEIYLADVDGKNQVKITSDECDMYPSWSPDGERIVFMSGEWHKVHISIVNRDGSGKVLLTTNQTNDGWPSWSPDGRKIIYLAYGDFNRYFVEERSIVKRVNIGGEIYIMDADGSNITRLTNNNVTETYPHISPDGTRVVFATADVGEMDIWVMNIDGTNWINLTNGGYYQWNTMPIWSPDGKKIAFTSIRGSDPYDQIYIMDSDGANQLKLTNSSNINYCPSWSPDGKKIAFISGPDRRNGDIYTMNADGSNQMRLTYNDGRIFWPTWSP